MDRPQQQAATTVIQAAPAADGTVAAAPVQVVQGPSTLVKVWNFFIGALFFVGLLALVIWIIVKIARWIGGR
jgi:hypothetical protein